MAKKKTVVKVPIDSQKCQTDIMKAVAELNGIEKMEVDASKGTLTIVGEVEPVPIFKKLKKIGKKPEIVSVGPPKPKCERWCSCSFCRPYVQCTPSHYSFVPSYPTQCELVAVTYPPPYDSEASSSGQCSIV